MRKALVVGIDYYKRLRTLAGCVHDAESVAGVLEVHGDGEKNFDVEWLLGRNRIRPVKRDQLLAETKKLFAANKVETALFYFAGHGSLRETGGYLMTSECEEPHHGLPLDDVMELAHASKADHKLIVLDTCHAGAAASRVTQLEDSVLPVGMTILAACTDRQNSEEENGAGIFTSLFVDALTGAAANLLGQISPGGAYAHIDQTLGAWQQRPVFKANVENFLVLRRVKPPIEMENLRKLTQLFPSPYFEYKLNPSFEPTSDRPNRWNTAKLAILQKYAKVNVVVPIGEEHMYYAAMNSKSCRLTALGRHYWWLVKKKRLGRTPPSSSS